DTAAAGVIGLAGRASPLTTVRVCGVSACTAAAAVAGTDGCTAAVVVRGAANAGAAGSIDFLGSIGGRNGSANRGRFGVTPGELFGKIIGVIMTTSSVRSFCAASLRKRRPRIGMSPMPGTFASVLFI